MKSFKNVFKIKDKTAKAQEAERYFSTCIGEKSRHSFLYYIWFYYKDSLLSSVSLKAIKNLNNQFDTERWLTWCFFKGINKEKILHILKGISSQCKMWNNESIFSSARRSIWAATDVVFMVPRFVSGFEIKLERERLAGT